MTETKILRIDNDADNAFYWLGEVIRNGGLVSFPTETVYGLGANAFSADAVSKIFEAKGRPSDNPLIVHISDISEVYSVAEEVPDAAVMLFEAFSPGPLTVVLKKKDSLPDIVTAGLSTVAVRIPSHPIARALIKAAGVPIAAPSSNLSGRPSPTEAEHVIADMMGRVDAIIDGGACSVGVESTVVEIVGDAVNILRPGGITKADIEKVLSNVSVDRHVTSEVKAGEVPKSPGMKYKHYAPDAEVTVVTGDRDKAAAKIRELIKQKSGTSTGVMCYDGYAFDCETVLYMGEDNIKYAERLFGSLRQFDALGVKVVFAQFTDDLLLGLALCKLFF